MLSKGFIGIVTIICLVYSNAIIGQSSTTTQLYIIGTKHTGNAFVTPATYLAVFSGLRPDIILVEFDSSLVKNCVYNERRGISIAQFLGIFKPSKEDIAVKKYVAKNSRVCVMPFDVAMTKRNQYVKLLAENERALYTALDALFYQGKMKEYDSLTYKRFLSASIEFWENTNSSLETMNSEKTIVASRNLMKYKNDSVPVLIKNYSEVSKFENWYKDELDYWIVRNEQMCNNIIKAVQSTKATKIIVLTGLLHKYMLLDCLQPKQQEHNFVLQTF
jgi:pheromone shutdown protein TraB